MSYNSVSNRTMSYDICYGIPYTHAPYLGESHGPPPRARVRAVWHAGSTIPPSQYQTTVVP
eukprot:1210604-Rhodomonas_salina.3